MQLGVSQDTLLQISVSTNGSRGMQQEMKRFIEDMRDISVSTNGSRGMQPFFGTRPQK